MRIEPDRGFETLHRTLTILVEAIASHARDNADPGIAQAAE